MKVERRRRSRHRAKNFARNYLKITRCLVCGTSENLTFHHVNPSEKKDNVSNLKSVRSVILEIQKCVVLCRHHHDVEHRKGPFITVIS